MLKPCKYFLGKYPFLHQIEKFYVDNNTREITVRVDGKHETILSENLSNTKERKSIVKRFHELLKGIIFNRNDLMDEEDFEKVIKSLNELLGQKKNY